MAFQKGQDTRRAMFAAARRRKPGEMNRVEAAYNEYLKLEQQLGRIAWFAYESIKLRLADRTFLTMDFAVLPVDGGILELHDTKGSEFMISEDAKVKMRVAAELYPFIFKTAIPRKRSEGGGWKITEI